MEGGGAAILPNTHTTNYGTQQPMEIGPMLMGKENMRESLLATAIPGLMNNPKDTKVNGKSKYARITIRKIKN